MIANELDQLYNYYVEIISIRKKLESMAEDVALFDETIANSIFTCIAAEISNRETDLDIHLKSHIL